jgi:hypothetical protein
VGEGGEGRYLSTERSRFSAAMMRSVEVGIQRSADGQTRAHRDPAGAGTDADAASAAVAAADACLTSSAAAILVVVAAAVEAARRMRGILPAALDSGEEIGSRSS